jgi:hypothetical protein
MDEPRMMGPLSEDHPCVGRECWACGVAFAVCDLVTLVATGPADEDDRARMEAGRPYTAIAEVVHWDCRARRPSPLNVEP